MRSFARNMVLACLALASAASAADGPAADRPPRSRLDWKALPPLPDAIGVAGPCAGVHHDALIVAGGANFPVAAGENLWQVGKVWHDGAWVLMRDGDGYAWRGGFRLDRPIGYAACASTRHGVVCIGGNDAKDTFAEVFLLRWDARAKELSQSPLPALPLPLVYGAAARIGDVVYIAGGQTDAPLGTATSFFARLDLSSYETSGADGLRWEVLPSWPGAARAFNMAAAQHNGFDDCIYVMGGRRQKPGAAAGGAAAGAGAAGAGVEFLADVYEFNPKRYDAAAFDAATGAYGGEGEYACPWRARAPSPTPLMAGAAVAVGQSHIFVLSGADGSLFTRADELKDEHPGFPKKTWAYHTITDTWIDAGPSPSNPVTTPAVRWGDAWVVASGEVRPRVRTPGVWRITLRPVDRSFGAMNMIVLCGYLAAMVGVGVFFARRNKSTDDYFRGGKRVLWWAAACSIFATMLSSITFMAIPAKAYAQDWVYLVGNMMIPVVAPLVVFLALPFFRRIDATSAYEYLHKRFNLGVRLLASALFTVFHVFRMAIVMSLAGLALATVTPMSPAQSVAIMGVLSIVYCTLGGVEAVIWTDTIQTFVLLGGAVLCFVLMLGGIEGGLGGMFDSAAAADKLNAFNFHLDASSASLAIWVVVIGALGQNISSYTGDQAVVQRYMTTPDEKRAARSIWLATGLSVPATFLFFGLGTALFAFYQSNPQKLDPSFMTDGIFPLFIADEVPAGVAGLIVAGIFAAAQSTISTSMNSTATAVVTDFMRPFGALKSERGYLNAARVLTVISGAAGTAIGLMFVDPDIKSLFDQFLKVVGLFMGVLGGLFALGVLTTRCSGAGALVGVVGGTAVVFSLSIFTPINGYLFAAIGITCCVALGYMASLVLPSRGVDLTGLTIHTRPR